MCTCVCVCALLSKQRIGGSNARLCNSPHLLPPNARQPIQPPTSQPASQPKPPTLPYTLLCTLPCDLYTTTHPTTKDKERIHTRRTDGVCQYGRQQQQQQPPQQFRHLYGSTLLSCLKNRVSFSPHHTLHNPQRERERGRYEGTSAACAKPSPGQAHTPLSVFAFFSPLLHHHPTPICAHPFVGFISRDFVFLFFSVIIF